MRKEDIAKITDALALKKEELLRYTDSQVKNIRYPETPSPVVACSKSESSSNVGYLGLGGGLVLTAIGLIKGSGMLTVGGVVIAVASFYSLRKQKGQKPVTQSPSFDYYVVTEKLNNAIKAIHNYVSDGWNEFLVSQQKDLLALIENSQLEVEKKNKLIEPAYRKTFIQYSMLDVLSDLSNIEKQKDIALYKQYVADFCKKYKNVVESAYIEQKAYLEDMIQYLS